jgi:pyruvate/2-oxoglutarate dehydrogenase complex dihydrolipoamide dehydrogenase (E3) component
MTVAVVERKLFGGTCVNTGCIPTKTLIASAAAARAARRSSEYGIGIEGSVRVDMARVKARKDAIAGDSRTGVESSLRKLDRCTVYEGHASFDSAHQIRVGSDRLTAGRIFINVGGRATVPSMPGLERVPYFTNSSMMGVDFIPPHLIIIGGSYIGLEFGQMYRRFGSRVTIVEMGPRLLQREDEDISAAILHILEQEGIAVRLNARCITVSSAHGQVVAGVDCAEHVGSNDAVQQLRDVVQRLRIVAAVAVG